RSARAWKATGSPAASAWGCTSPGPSPRRTVAGWTCARPMKRAPPSPCVCRSTQGASSKPAGKADPTLGEKGDPMTNAWPELAYEGWKDTLDTVHRWTQVVGKVALACSPRQNHWWNVGLQLTATGLRTGPLQRPDGTGAFDLAFDFVDHQLQLRTQDGAHQTLPLVPCSVATFHDAFFAALQRAGIEVTIRDQPCEIAVDALPLSQDEMHRSYDPEAVERFFAVLSSTGHAL